MFIDCKNVRVTLLCHSITRACPPYWWSGPWQACTADEVRQRTVLCLHKNEKGEISVLSDESCLDIKPPHLLNHACHHDDEGESGSAASGFLEDEDVSSSAADISGSARYYSLSLDI